MRNQYRKKGINRILGILCALVLLVSAIYVPMAVSAAGDIPSVDIVDNKAYVFDFNSPAATSTENKDAATGDAAIGYYGWGWSVKDGVLRSNKNNVNQSWATSGGYRLHTKISDDAYGFYALEPSTRYVVSFKIRVLSSPVTISGSKETNKAYINIGYNSSYNSTPGTGVEDCYINGMSTSIKVMDSLIDSNMFTLYDSNGNASAYACGEDWHTATYFITTPASFTKDNALAFYTSTFHGVDTEIDDVSITKIGADSGIVLLKDEYSATDELFFGKEGEKINLAEKDINDRAKDPSHTFVGWYADVERTQKIDEVAFSKGEDKTVYSRWNAPVTITFKNTLDGSETKITGMAGDAFEYPKDPVDPEGKVWFMGWYKDEAGTTAHLVPQYGYADETIYTYWKGEIPGLTQDFEDYTKEQYTISTDATTGQKYKSNRLYFAPTMTKQSEVTYGDSGNAIKYHWNPVQITDKEDHNYYNASRVTSYDNYFHLGKGLENGTLYNVTFKYLAEKADAPVSFYMVTGVSNNAWENRTTYDTLKNVKLESDGKWHEITFQFTTNFNGSGIDVFFGINNIEKGEGTGIETIVYFDDIEIEAFAQPYESVITINTNLDGEVINIKGKRGDEIKLPEIEHHDGGVFRGWFLDKEFTVPYEGKVFERLPVTIYGKWAEYFTINQGFENYTQDAYEVKDYTKDNGTANDKSDDFTVKYRNNYLYFYTTMSKQSKEVNSGNYAVKFHWNTDPALDKDVSKPDGKNAQNGDSYEQKRYSSDDNLFYVGSGLDSNQPYTLTFKYKVEEADQEIQFYVLSAISNNSWGSRKMYAAPQKVQLKPTDGWVEYSYEFTTGELGSANAAFLGIRLTENDDVIMYFDDIKIRSHNTNEEVIMTLETNTAQGIVKHVAKRGEPLNLPKLTHSDGAEFLGWFTDAAYTTPYTATVYPNSNTYLYAKWTNVAMTFKEYPYASDPQNDPNIFADSGKGMGKDDDYALRWYVNRKEDNKTGVGTTQSALIAKGIVHDGIYRVKFDYKGGASQTNLLSFRILSGDSANLWWNDVNYYYQHTYTELPAGGTNGWKSAEFIIKANVRQTSYGKGEELYIRFNGQTQKAGEKIDIYLDNVLVEMVEAPYVYFDGQNGGAGELVTGKAGDEIKAPAPPSRVGYSFAGWYNEPECETKFELKTLEADTAVIAYAKWNESSTYVYSFENYTCTETSGYVLRNGKVVSNIKKSGKNALRIAYDEANSITAGMFALEDGGEMYKLERNRDYVITVNYYIKEYTDTPLSMQFLASAYKNIYVGRNTGKTYLCGAIAITSKEAKEQKGKWMTKSFACTTADLDSDIYTELHCYLSGIKGWEIYIDDVTVRPLAKGQVAVAFNAEGAKGCPDYLIGKPGQSYEKKVPETLTKEGMMFKGYFTKSADGTFLEKTRGNMVFGEKSELIYARFLDYEIIENFDEGFYNKAYGKGLGYTIHDFDYEVYDSEKEGNSKDNVTSGRYSLHRKGNSMFKENSVILTLGNQIAEGERYTVTMKVKLGKHFHTDGAVKIVSSRSFEYAWTTTGDYYPVVPIADLKQNEWVEVSYTFNSVEGFVTIQTPGYVELFIDDVKFTLVDETVPLSEPKEYTEYVAAERDENGNLLYKDRTAFDVSTVIDKSLSAKSFPWLYVGIGAGALVLVAVVLVLVLVVFKKKKA